jgi:hypothetical protein
LVGEAAHTPEPSHDQSCGDGKRSGLAFTAAEAIVRHTAAHQTTKGSFATVGAIPSVRLGPDPKEQCVVAHPDPSCPATGRGALP